MENWKDITIIKPYRVINNRSYYFQVSDMGRVRRPEIKEVLWNKAIIYGIEREKAKKIYLPERILKLSQNPNSKHGSNAVNIQNQNFTIKFLVAYYFVENPKNYNKVRIIDYTKPITSSNLIWSEKEWEKPLVLKTKKCIICNNDFELPKPYLKKTCSKECAFSLYSKTAKGRKLTTSAKESIRLKHLKPIAAKKGNFEIFFPSIQASCDFFERKGSTLSNIINGVYPSLPKGYSLRFI